MIGEVAERGALEQVREGLVSRSLRLRLSRLTRALLRAESGGAVVQHPATQAPTPAALADLSALAQALQDFVRRWNRFASGARRRRSYLRARSG